jgi:hypothetical protein
MSINIDELNNKKINKLIKDKNLEEYDNYYQKEKYKVSLVNVDSAFREVNPKNIYSSNVTYLPENPLTFTANSSSITFNYPNHNLVEGSSIIIQNVQPISYVVSGNLYLFNYNPYLFIKIKNNVNLGYLNLLNRLKIQINVVSNSNLENVYYYGNIPINSIIGTFDIDLPSVINKTYTISQTILDFFNVQTAGELDSDFLLIQLPFNYFSTTYANYEITDFYEIVFLDLYGIPINGINSDFPINNERLQGLYDINQVIDKNTFIINTTYQAISTGVGGGNKVQVMLINNSIEGFPNSNNYIVRLKKNFNSVVRIELVSSEFPYIDYLIKSSGVNQNNNIYWKHLDDGNTIYTASINEGNYDSTSLITALTNSINSVKRINSTSENIIYNNFEITCNTFTNEVTFSAYKTENLPNCLKVDIYTINNIDYFRLIIKHPNNLVQVNNKVIVSNSLDIGLINKSYINKSFTVYEVNIENSSYNMLIAPVNQITSSNNLGTTLTDSGGGAIQITSNARISLLFNYPNTIGAVLGFKNTGSQNSITPYKNIISNFDSYVNDKNLNSVGNIVTSHQLLNFVGNNNYYLLYLNDYELVSNTSNQENAFAKILLSGQPGDILFNTFINYPLEFDFPISTLNELQIKILYPDGTYPDFRNIDHSFTLRITELVNYPKNTGINSKKTTFLNTMKEIVNGTL